MRPCFATDGSADQAEFEQERFLQPGADNVQDLPALKENGHVPQSGAKLSKPKRYFPFSLGLRSCVGKNLGEITVCYLRPTLASSGRLYMLQAHSSLQYPVWGMFGIAGLPLGCVTSAFVQRFICTLMLT